MDVIVAAIPVFVALMAAEFGVGLMTGRNVYRLNDAVGSLSAGILSQISGVFMLALSVWIYVLVYSHFSLFALPAVDWRVWLGGTFLAYAPGLPLTNGLIVFLAIAASLWAVGALLDGRISVLEALYVFAAALTSAAYALDWPSVEAASKPAALALLIAAFVPREGPRDVKGLVLAGLAASLAGDVFLLSPATFLPGLVAFLITHGFYIAAFARGVGFLPSRLAVACIGAFAAAVFAYVWPGVGGGMRAGVVAYAAILACDAAQATGRATLLRSRAAVAVATGAILFMLSDMTIALVKFGHVGWPADQWTLPTYYLAQGLIAFCVLPRAQRKEIRT